MDLRSNHIAASSASRQVCRYRCGALKNGFGGEPIAPLHAELTRAAPANASLHRQVSGLSITFGAHGNRIVFPLAPMIRDNPAADAEVFPALVELCERRLAEHAVASVLPDMRVGSSGLRSRRRILT
ncbi:AraC family transcriptional regulator ligand-binding domain-containing protein [Labrenzia suaedae]|uniref:AraC family transcriptional regulator ligand-binding domain-containing protein n=1 Tax=Roseibium litorale TaxID=2803841 RepID=A0ABR9CIM5_9HYPH|nr:AraC family transcriptional regulator ligand-binding domain-containing protein [Roseibium litorale]